MKKIKILLLVCISSAFVGGVVFVSNSVNNAHHQTSSKQSSSKTEKKKQGVNNISLNTPYGNDKSYNDGYYYKFIDNQHGVYVVDRTLDSAVDYETSSTVPQISYIFVTYKKSANRIDLSFNKVVNITFKDKQSVKKKINYTVQTFDNSPEDRKYFKAHYFIKKNNIWYAVWKSGKTTQMVKLKAINRQVFGTEQELLNYFNQPTEGADW